MSVTIDSLDIQIRSSAGSAAKNIGELAVALGNLNANAKVTKIVNSLERLNGALTNMKSQQSVMSHLSALNKSLSSLASLPQLTGLRSAINELKKLPAVMQGLDTAQISQFASQMKLLASGLGPLATQIDKIATGFSRLPTQINQCVSATKKLDTANKSVTRSTKAHSDALNGQSFNLLATYEHLSNVFNMMHGIQNAISRILSDAIEWDGVEYQFGNAFGEEADKYYEKVQQVTEALGINKQDFMENSAMASSMLIGFGVGASDARTMGIGYTELAYDIWAAYNNVYKTLDGAEGAMAAVRSAISGEVEPIRRAGFTIVDSQLAITAANHGLEYSTQKATEAQKSYLRYLTLVDQAQAKGIVGTYAREMDTAEGTLRRLTQQVKTLTQAVGSLFIPIIQAAIPWITAFVQILTDGVRAVAAFFGIEIQKIDWSDSVSGVGDMAESAEAATGGLSNAAEAAKKLKHYTMGFDELNVIDPNSGSGDSGASGAGGAGSFEGLDVSTLWDQALLDSASQQVDKLKQKIVDFYNEWRWQIEAFGAGTMLIALGNIVEKLKEAEIFSGGFLRNMNTISKIGLSTVIVTLQWMLMDEFLENFIQEGAWEEYIKAAVVAALGTWALGAQWGPKGVIIGLGVTAAVSLKATFEDGSVDSIEEVTTGLTGLAAAAGAIGVAVKKLPKDKGWIGGLVNGLGLLFKGKITFGGLLSGLFPGLASVVSSATAWVTGTLAPGIVSALGALASALGISVGAAAALVAGVIVAAIVSAILVVKYWDEIKFFFTDTLPKWFEETGAKIGAFFSGAWEKTKEIWGVVAQWFDENVIQPVVNFFAPIVDWISEFFRGCWMIIRAVWVTVAEWFKTNVATPVSKKFSEATTAIGGFFSDLWKKVKDIWDIASSWFNNTVIKPVVGWFQGAWKNISGFFSNLWSEVKDIWKGVSTWFNTKVVEPVVKFFSDAWTNISDAFEEAFNGIATFAKTIFNGIIGKVEGIINGVIGGINWLLGGFNQVVTWAAKVLGENWGGLTLIQRVELPRLMADGGFVGAGQMFIAREAGPELVGNIGGRTAVANNDQIVEGIAAGVYRAVVQAMSESNGQNQNVNVYLDGKQLYNSVKRTEAQRGRTLMGSQLGYAY